MVGVEHSRGLGLCTVWVEPSMQLHATLMTLVYHPLQGVPVGRGSLALLSGEKSAPRLKVALVQSVTLGTHLKEYSVDTILLQFVKLID